MTPVVSDSAGNLYNKDAIIQYLLPDEASSMDKSEANKVLQGRVKSLKDVVEVQFEENPDERAASIDQWICPVTLKPLGPAVKAVYLVPCGHAFSLEATKEMKGETCLQCGVANESQRDVVPIFPMTEEEREILQKRLQALAAQGLTHSLKKVSGKKRKANGAVVEASSLLQGENIQSEVEESQPQRKDVPKPEPGPRSNTPASGISTPKMPHGIQNAATASLTAKVLAEEEARKKRRLMVGENENLKSLFSKSETIGSRKDGDFMTRGFSVASKARNA